MENNENKYNNALEKLQETLAPKNGCKISGLTRDCIEEIFPELKESKESEDEKIRKSIIESLKGNMYRTDGDYDLLNKQIAWLEKQESVEEIVSRCKKSWYNEGRIDGKFEGIADDEKYQQGWHDAVEKAVEWLYQRQAVDLEVSDIEKFVKEFKKYMEGGEE